MAGAAEAAGRRSEGGSSTRAPRLDVEEAQLVAELAALINGDEPPPVPEGLDAERFEALCHQHGVASAIARAPGAPRRPALALRHLKHFARSVEVEERRDRALSALADAGQSAIVLKGADWAFRVYPDPGMRPMVDIDLLAPPGQIAAVVQALDAIGYSVDPREEGFLEGGYTVGLMSAEPQAVRIEVHPDLCRRTRYDIDVGSLFERSVPLGDSPAGRRMCDVDSLLYAAVHHALHGYRIQLLWLLDFALLAHVCGQDDAVRERAGQWGARTAMATSRRLAEALFGPLPLPPSRWSAGGYLEALVSADHLRMNRFDDDRRARISSAVALLDRGRAAYLFDSLLRRITKK